MSNFKLFSEATIKLWYSETGTTNFNGNERSQLITMMNGIISRAEQFCNIYFDYKDDFTEILKPVGSKIYVNRRPIASIQSIIPMVDGEYSTDNIVSEDLYYFEDNKIVLKSGLWSNCKYQVTYSGGYTEYLDGSEVNNLPDDLAEAFLMQLRFEFANRSKIGITASTDRDGTRTQYNQWGFLPGVKTILMKYQTL